MVFYGWNLIWFLIRNLFWKKCTGEWEDRWSSGRKQLHSSTRNRKREITKPEWMNEWKRNERQKNIARRGWMPPAKFSSAEPLLMNLQAPDWNHCHGEHSNIYSVYRAFQPRSCSFTDIIWKYSKLGIWGGSCFFPPFCFVFFGGCVVLGGFLTVQNSFHE